MADDQHPGAQLVRGMPTDPEATPPEEPTSPEMDEALQNSHLVKKFMNESGEFDLEGAAKSHDHLLATLKESRQEMEAVRQESQQVRSLAAEVLQIVRSGGTKSAPRIENSELAELAKDLGVSVERLEKAIGPRISPEDVEKSVSEALEKANAPVRNAQAASQRMRKEFGEEYAKHETALLNFIQSDPELSQELASSTDGKVYPVLRAAWAELKLRGVKERTKLSDEDVGDRNAAGLPVRKQVGGPPPAGRPDALQRKLAEAELTGDTSGYWSELFKDQPLFYDEHMAAFLGARR